MEKTENPSDKTDKKTFKRGIRGILRHLRPYKKSIIFISIMGVIGSIASGFMPFIVGKFIDSLIVVADQGSGAPITFSVILLVLWLLAQVASDIFKYVVDRLGRKVNAKIHTSIDSNGFTHLLRLPITFHRNNKMQDLMERLSRTAWRISSLITQIVSIAPSLLSILFGLVLALTINIKLSVVLIVGVLVYLVLLAINIRPAAKLDEQSHVAWNAAWDAASSAVNQIDSVKQAAAEDYEEKKIRKSFLKDTFEPWYKMEVVWSNVGFLQEIIVSITQLTIFVLSIKFVADGTISVGDLVAFNSYAIMFFVPLAQFGYGWQTFQNGITSAAFAEDIFEEETEIYNPEDSVAKRIKGDMKFDDVTFAYNSAEKDVLENINIEVKAGESIALVGESGSGKSTFISLLSAYFFPQKGQVFIDGVDTRKLNLMSLRSQIAVVPQEVALFNDTIANNIKYGSHKAGQHEIAHAAKEAHLHDFIEGLDQKYETVVGERGMKLSVGQKQRVAIARAILRDPKILILDEPTSALDAMTEKNITESLEKLMKDRTTFIIAHRLSTVRKADKIIVFDKGRIVESGTHKELIEKEGGYYKRLHDYQIGLY